MTRPQIKVYYDAKTSAYEILEGQDLTGQAILITGANSGIGFSTAKALASVNAKIIMACRNLDTANEAKASILEEYPNANIEVRELNLASFDNVNNFCAELGDTPIDILICNAGCIFTDYQETKDGIEAIVGVCHFGHALLVQKLLPNMKDSSIKRVIMLSSESHRTPPTLNFSRFPLSRQQFKFLVAYGQAKLANVLFAKELHKRYGADGITACSVHPGALVTTNFGRHSKWMDLVFKLVSPLTKSSDQGAATTVYCATIAKSQEIAGQYLSHCKVQVSSRESRRADIAEELWQVTQDRIQQWL